MTPKPSADGSGPVHAAQVGFIGPGRLGEPAVGRLLQAGIRLRVLARRRDVADRLQAAGAEVTGEAAVCARDVPMVILFVYSDEQVREVALGPAGVVAAMAPGSRLVVHSTISLETLQDLTSAAEARAVEVIDAPVSGTAQDVAAGNLTVLAGGSPEGLQQVEEVVGAYANPFLRLGPGGSAIRVKLLNNLLFAANVQLAVEAERLATRLGLDPRVALDAVQHSSASTRAIGYLLLRGSSEDFAAGAGPYLRKDVDACRRTAAYLGVELGLLETVVRSGALPLG